MDGATMFTNRISDQFGFQTDVFAMLNTPIPQAKPTPPMASLQDIFKAAAEQAKRDYELDKLFNPEFYSEDGSGI